MNNVHLWIAERRKQQNLPALFADAWLIAHGSQCQSNRPQIDAQHYERNLEVPDYIYTVFERERRSTTH